VRSRFLGGRKFRPGHGFRQGPVRLHRELWRSAGALFVLPPVRRTVSLHPAAGGPRQVVDRAPRTGAGGTAHAEWGVCTHPGIPARGRVRVSQVRRTRAFVEHPSVAQAIDRGMDDQIKQSERDGGSASNRERNGTGSPRARSMRIVGPIALVSGLSAAALFVLLPERGEFELWKSLPPSGAVAQGSSLGDSSLPTGLLSAQGERVEVQLAADVEHSPPTEPVSGVGGWPQFAKGSFGALLQRYTSAPWEDVEHRVSHIDLDASPESLGVKPWAQAVVTAEDRMVDSALRKAGQEVSVRTLGFRSIDEFEEALTELHAPHGDGLSRVQAQSMAEEARVLHEAIVLAVQEQVEAQVAVGEYSHSPKVGWLAMRGGGGDVVYERMVTADGWVVSVTVSKHDLPTVAAEIDALTALADAYKLAKGQID